MTKKGRDDAYWDNTLRQYARGKHKFKTGQKPGKKKWKDALTKIDKCPLHGKDQTTDLLGNKIPCNCGYHEVTPTQGPLPTTQAGPSQGVPHGTHSSSASHDSAAQPQASLSLQAKKEDLSGSSQGSIRKHGARVTFTDVSEQKSRPVQRKPEAVKEDLTGSSRGSILKCRASPSHVTFSHVSEQKSQPVQREPEAVKMLLTPTRRTTPQALSIRDVQRDRYSSTPLPAIPQHESWSGEPKKNVAKVTAHYNLPAAIQAKKFVEKNRTGTTATKQISQVKTVKCGKCQKEVQVDELMQHLSDFHAKIKCDQCGREVTGEVGLLQHVDAAHAHEKRSKAASMLQVEQPTQEPKSQKQTPGEKSTEQATSTSEQQTHVEQPHIDAPLMEVTDQLTPYQPLTEPPVLAELLTRTPDGPINLVEKLPKQFKKVFQPGDMEWVASCLYDSQGKFRENFTHNWFHPTKPTRSPPDPVTYFRQRLFLWAPMRMWGIPLKCPTCNVKMYHGGIYTKAREVIDLESRYYLVGEYPRCSKCMIPICPWSVEILNQLDPAHRCKFPAILTTQLALDKNCVTLMKPRILGNSSSYIRQALDEIHSEEWAKRVLEYLADCELHKRKCDLMGARQLFMPPPRYRSLPLSQWFETVHSNEILSHLDEMKAVMTSTYGRILKLDSTKKISKKLAGGVGETAAWMTNIGNEIGQVLNCVMTVGEGAALEEVCQGIVQRYREAGEPAPEVIYVDRDCCAQSADAAVLQWFRPWKPAVRLDIFHFMRRFGAGLITEHHPLYGTFCSKLSSCNFEWDEEDYSRLKFAKKYELAKKSGVVPCDKQIVASITTSELTKHCRRRTRGVEVTRRLIQGLLDSMWELTDSTGLRLMNQDSMTHIWEVQQKHLPCIQDIPGVDLYTRVGTIEKGGRMLDVLRCARGSSSLESFHRHQCNFIPSWRSNAVHAQMYILEGGSRWNLNRAHDAVDQGETSGTTLYDVHLMSQINVLSSAVLGKVLLPEFQAPGKYTGEKIGVDYLLAQSGRGDLHPPAGGEILPPEIQLEEDDTEDTTVSHASDINPDISVATQERTECPNCHQTILLSEFSIHMASHFDESKYECSLFSSMFVSEELLEHHMKIHTVQFGSHSPSSDFPSSTHGSASPSPRTTEGAQSSSSAPSLITSQALGPPADDGDQANLDSIEELRYDTRGMPGWESVDKLAAYLVNLNRTVTALSTQEAAAIVNLYKKLDSIDRAATNFEAKSRAAVLGQWRTSRKRSGSAPGQQVAERLYLTHGIAAQRPDSNRISECVCLHLLREYKLARNRPLDRKGKVLPLQQAIVHTYSNIQQLVEDSQDVQQKTNLVLVTINNTTLSKWLNERQKRVDRDALLQGVDLPEQVSVANIPLPPVIAKPTLPVQHGHTSIQFDDPPNREGESQLRPRKRKASASATLGQEHGDIPRPDLVVHVPGQSRVPVTTGGPTVLTEPLMSHVSGPSQVSGMAEHYYQSGHQPNPWAGWYDWPRYPSWPSWPSAPTTYQPPVQPPPPPPPPPPQPLQLQTPGWYRLHTSKEDEERRQRGEPPKKRYQKRKDVYQCTRCGLSKTKITGHTQYKGKWYCPSSGLTVDEWKLSLKRQT